MALWVVNKGLKSFPTGISGTTNGTEVRFRHFSHRYHHRYR